jgi:hypothetical protein
MDTLIGYGDIWSERWSPKRAEGTTMTSHIADVQQSPRAGHASEARRDEVLRAAGVRMPSRPVTERQRFIARRRPWWLAALIRIFT